MIFTAGQGHRLGIYYIPMLGKAPHFARYLETVTEELEESELSSKHNRAEIFLGMTFVDKQMLTDLNALSLIGTKTLKPHMHGYFIDTKLYKELRNKITSSEDQIAK